MRLSETLARMLARPFAKKSMRMNVRILRSAAEWEFQVPAVEWLPHPVSPSLYLWKCLRHIPLSLWVAPLRGGYWNRYATPWQGAAQELLLFVRDKYFAFLYRTVENRTGTY
jgi:hypothetical protein